MLAVASSPDEAGVVEISPTKEKFDTFDVITLRAMPNPGYVFESWSGEVDVIKDTSQPTAIFVMRNTPDNRREITANFARSEARYIVSVSLTPSNGGSVALQPAQPEGGYPVNQRVSVRADANQGYAFKWWLGALSVNENPNENPISILVNEDKSVIAVFNPTVSVYCSPTNGGSVTLQPASAIGYTVGSEVTLTATPSKGYRFAGWEGDVSGSARSIVIAVNDAKTVTARFRKESASSWWIWAVVGIGGLLGALIFTGLVHARIKSRYQGELYEPER